MSQHKSLCITLQSENYGILDELAQITQRVTTDFPRAGTTLNFFGCDLVQVLQTMNTVSMHTSKYSSRNMVGVVSWRPAIGL